MMKDLTYIYTFKHIDLSDVFISIKCVMVEDLTYRYTFKHISYVFI